MPLINVLVVSGLRLYIFTILGVCLCCILESVWKIYILLTLKIYSQIPLSGTPAKSNFFLVKLFSLVFRLVSYQLRLSKTYFSGPSMFHLLKGNCIVVTQRCNNVAAILWRHSDVFIMLSKARKFYIGTNNNKVDSIETGHTVIAHLLPWTNLEKWMYGTLF